MSDKLQISIYKIEDDHNSDDLKRHLTDSGYEKQNTKKTISTEHSVDLYYQRKTTTPKWKGFIASTTSPNQKITKPHQSSNERYILLLQNKVSKNIYAVTGGAGHFSVQDYISGSFGIDIISRLITKEDKTLRATKETSLVGGVLGTSKHFRNNFSLFENDGFGKIYQELKTNLNEKMLLAKFGFSDEEIKKTGSACVAKASFRIEKTIEFEQLEKIIKGCETIIEEDEVISINNVEKLYKKRSPKLIETLNKELIIQLWNRYQNGNGSYDFDLCHTNFDSYLTAEIYSLYGIGKFKSVKEIFDKLNDIDLLFDRIKKLDVAPSTLKEFNLLVQALRITAYDASNVPTTSGHFLSHLLGDVTCDEKKYFYVDKNWYSIKDAFVTELNEYCAHLIEDKYCNNLNKKWAYSKNMTENAFNAQFFGDDKTIVLDQVTADNIELCDILKWDDNNVYLYHIKAGMGNTMRDLTAQISIAANKLNHDLNNNKNFLKTVYKSLKKKIGGDDYFDKAGKQTNNYSEEEFIELFTSNRNISFVLAVLDTANKNRPLKEIKRFRSNIAKFSIQELSKNIRIHDKFSLLIEQIYKT